MTQEEPRARRRWIRSLFLWVVVSASGLFVAGVAGAILVSRTLAGRELALEWALSRVAPAINGSLAVGSLASTGLLGGGTLYDVQLSDTTGHPVLVADSVRARYSVAGLLGGSPTIADLAIWGVAVDLAPESGEGISLRSLLAERDSSANDAEDASSTDAHSPFLRIRGLSVRSGTLVLPDDDGSRRHIRGIDADFPTVEILPTPDLYLTARTERAALSWPMEGGTLDLSDIEGDIELDENRARLDADRFRLPGTVGGGLAERISDGDGSRAILDLDLERLALTDLGWIDERFDHGVAHGRVRIVSAPDRLEIDFAGVEADLGTGGRVAFDGLFLPGDTVGFAELRVAPDLLATTELQRFLPRELPVTGLLSGDLRFNGTGARLGVAGELTMVTGADAQADTLVHLVGGGTSLGSGGVADVAVAARSLDYALLEVVAPGRGWHGRGDMTIRADGRLETGLAIEITADHTAADGAINAVALSGSVYGDTAISVVDLEATMNPLSVATLNAVYPDLDLSGSVAGSLAMRGGMERLALDADLQTDAGPLAGEAVINAADPGASYDIAASSPGLHLSRLVPGLPDSTFVSGSARLSNGSGLDLASLRGALALEAGPSTIGSLRVDSARVSAWVDDDGLLNIDTLDVRARGIEVRGRGNIGAAPGVRGDGVALSVSSPSIRPLRDIFMGANLVAWDELLPMEQDLMIAMDGVDPDTFPRSRDIRFEGRVDGSVDLTGGLDSLSVATAVTIAGLQYGHASAGSVSANVVADGIKVPGRDPMPIEIGGTVTGTEVSFRDREFQSATVEGAFNSEHRGRFRALVERSETESYDVQAVVGLDEHGGRIDLDRLTLVLEDRRWNLRGPARLEWNPEVFEVSDFDLIRPGGDGLDLHADGHLARSGGDSRFEFRVADLDLGVVGSLFQMEAPPSGILAAALNVRGSGEDPDWDGAVRVEGAEYLTLVFDSVTASGAFADRSLETDIETWTSGRRTLALSGTMPLDLRLASVEERIPDLPVDLAIVADSFPAWMILGGLQGLDQIGGTMSGSVALGGRPSDLEPDGALRLDGVSAVVEAFGIRPSSVDVDLDLSPDGVVVIEGTAASGGTMEFEGTVGLGQLADSIPLDLTFRPRSFQIVDRSDMEAAISSDAVTLTGSYRFPYIEGAVDVEGGTVFMEEFQRTSEAVDLYDPDLVLAAAVEIGADRDAEDEVVAERIPFLQNLTVFVEMRVGRDNFVRSRQMNVETTGDLSLTFNRRVNQLILQGEMEVARGNYSFGPTTLGMTEGIFRFVGTPGFNPGLAITAEGRVPTREGQPLVITADISGTLLSPALRLSSDAEMAMSEADLINYLVLGRPTSAVIGDVGAAAGGAGRNLLLGQFANEIGYLVALELGFDHLSVSQAEQGQANAAFGASSLQVEIGRYVLDDVFLTGVYQRGFCADPTFPVNSGGVRVEVGMPRDVRLEGFLESRCTRERYRGLGDAALELERIWGFSLFREWGY